MGIVTPEILFEALDIVQYTAVLIAAVALELAFWAHAPALERARAIARHIDFDIEIPLFSF
jgi:hypothetical protein